MNTQKEGLNILREVGAIMTGGHFVYTSGKHGTAYDNKDKLFENPQAADRICRMMAAIASSWGAEVVIGPSMGSIGYAMLVALHLGGDIRAAYAEKQVDGTFKVRASFAEAIAGRKVIVVEDILNTGGSALRVVEAARKAGGEVTGVVAICNRGGVTTEQLGKIPLLGTLIDSRLDAWDEADCPMCREGVPINVAVGHGEAFLASQ